MFQGIALLTNHDWFCFIDGPCQNSGKMLEYLCFTIASFIIFSNIVSAKWQKILCESPDKRG